MFSDMHRQVIAQACRTVEHVYNLEQGNFLMQILMTNSVQLIVYNLNISTEEQLNI